jgi:hypothetical protein
MMLQRTLARSACNSHSACRLRTRSFHAWSGAALSRYFHKSGKDEPRPESSHRNEPSTPVSDEEMAKRRERLQELLQRVNAERADKQKTG